MDNINALVQLDWLTVLLGIFVILFGAREIINLISWYKNKFRIKTGAEEEKDEIEERISRLERHDKDQYEKIDRILDGIDALRTDFTDKAIEDYRFEILDMASALSSGRKYNRDQYQHIMQIHEKYERLLASINKTNGQTDASMEIIMESYKQCLKEGF